MLLLTEISYRMTVIDKFIPNQLKDSVKKFGNLFNKILQNSYLLVHSVQVIRSLQKNLKSLAYYLQKES